MQDDEASSGEASWGELWQRRYRKMMLLAAGLPLLQQASGINSVIFYSSSVSTVVCLFFAVSCSALSLVLSIACRVLSCLHIACNVPCLGANGFWLMRAI